MRIITIPVLALGLALSTAAVAETPPPYPDFTFKRIKPPKPGEKKHIVQIKPGDGLKPLPKKKPKPAADEATVQTAAAATSPAVPRPGRYEWFWQAVSPSISESNPGRLEPVLQQMAGRPVAQQVSAPRLDHMMTIARSYGSDILRTTAGTRVSPALVLAVIAVESSGRADAVSGAGAAGLMQLMPATAERFGVTDRSVPSANIRGGVAYLNWLMGEFGEDPILVLAGYNAGEGAVRSHSGVPPYSETRDYVPKVLAAFEVARGLCRTRPMFISDGCVFATSG